MIGSTYHPFSIYEVKINGIGEDEVKKELEKLNLIEYKEFEGFINITSLLKTHESENKDEFSLYFLGPDKIKPDYLGLSVFVEVASAYGSSIYGKLEYIFTKPGEKPPLFDRLCVNVRKIF